MIQKATLTSQPTRIAFPTGHIRASMPGWAILINSARMVYPKKFIFQFLSDFSKFFNQNLTNVSIEDFSLRISSYSTFDHGHIDWKTYRLCRNGYWAVRRKCKRDSGKWNRPDIRVGLGMVLGSRNLELKTNLKMRKNRKISRTDPGIDKSDTDRSNIRIRHSRNRRRPAGIRRSLSTTGNSDRSKFDRCKFCKYF